MDRFEWVRSRAEGKILEVGSAGGAIFVGSGLDVHYCDINEFPLPNFTVADAHNLPFPDGSFTTVSICELLEHVKDPLQVLREAARVSSRKVIFTVPFEYLWTSDKLPFMSVEDRMKQDGLTKEEEYKQGNPTVTQINSLDEAWHQRWFTRASLEELLGQLQLPYTIELLQYDGWAFLVGEISKPVPVPKDYELPQPAQVKITEDKLKILVISTTVFPVPLKGYGGLEQLAYAWSCEFQKMGHKVALVAPIGSTVPEGMELITTPVMVDEAEAYPLYKERLGEFDVIMDNSWLWYTVIAQMEAGDKQLPVVHIHHSDPDFLPNPPPIKFPCLVGLSKDQAKRISEKWNFEVRPNYNGIPIDFYRFDPSIQRNGRYLFCARFTPEKAPMEAIQLARKCNASLDLYGNTEIIRDQNYLNECMANCDAKDVVFHLEVPREETVKLYQSHKALIHWVNYNEAWGLTITESMACGCPVISKNSGAMSEQIIHGKTGFLCDTLEEMEAVIREDKVSTIKAEDCVERASLFSIENSAKGYLELFREVVAGRVW